MVSQLSVRSNSRVGLIPGVIIACAYWNYAIKIWISWALKNGASDILILKVGRSGLLLWNRRPIDVVLKSQSA